MLPYKLYEVTKYYTVIPNATLTMWALEINTKTWHALTKAQQDAINRATLATHKFQFAEITKQLAAGPATLKAAAPQFGCQSTVAAGDLANWEKAAHVVREAFAKDVGPTGDRVLAEIDASQRSAAR